VRPTKFGGALHYFWPRALRTPVTPLLPPYQRPWQSSVEVELAHLDAAWRQLERTVRQQKERLESLNVTDPERQLRDRLVLITALCHLGHQAIDAFILSYMYFRWNVLCLVKFMLNGIVVHVSMLSMAVARSFPGGFAIRYVLPFLWMTSCLHISVRIGDARILKLTR